MHFPQPTVIDRQDTILMLAQLFAEGSDGAGTTYEILLSGSKFEAVIRRDDKVVRRERIDILPILNAWITDLLNRKDTP